MTLLGWSCTLRTASRSWCSWIRSRTSAQILSRWTWERWHDHDYDDDHDDHDIDGPHPRYYHQSYKRECHNDALDILDIILMILLIDMISKMLLIDMISMMLLIDMVSMMLLIDMISMMLLIFMISLILLIFSADFSFSGTKRAMCDS